MKKNIYLVLGMIALLLFTWLLIKSLSRKDSASTGGKHRSLSSLYNEAKTLESEGAYLNSQALLKDIIEKAKDKKLIDKAHEDLMELNVKILFSPLQTKDSEVYTVVKGDTLSKIAKKYNTTVGLIMRSNKLRSDIIRPGQRLKVSKAVYSVIVDCSDNILTLKSNDSSFKKYVVATGINNATPIGEFKIINKLKDPVWYKAGAIVSSGSPDNILGTRWMGISVAGYGIHGTTQPESIGTHVTAGCVRMLNNEVEELYDILPIGTTVTITD